MSSLTFCGRPLSPYVSAELEWPAAHSLAAETARVPGRPGLALVSADVEPLELRVRLHLDAPEALTAAERAGVRRTIRAWLLADGGGTLVVPGEPGLEWHDVVCAGSTGWTGPLADASSTVTFLCLDPMAYGAERSSAGDAFDVGGTWPTRPVVELTATAGSGASVACTETGERVELARALAAGDLVRIDCGAQTAAVNGADATADVTLGSDFFGLAPGRAALAFEGCSSHLVSWRERWA